MAETVLEGSNLGEKHANYNKIFKARIAENQVEKSEINFNKNDVENLLQIDIACYRRDVESILKILQCTDELYVSRVIKKSTWLINDETHSHIVNPNYLCLNLFPYMTTKAVNKFLKHIQLNLKDESRVEKFYENEKCPKKALKWLPYCSVEFIEKNITKHLQHLNSRMFKRLCERSHTIFEIVTKEFSRIDLLQATMFLLKVNVDNYLDVVEGRNMYDSPQFSSNATELIMQRSPERIMNNFERYVNVVDMRTFAKYIKKEDAKNFLYKIAEKLSNSSCIYQLQRFFRSEEILYLIQRIPKEEQFEFVKMMFIDNTFSNDHAAIPLARDSDEYKMYTLSCAVKLQKYIWYQFAPFNVAFAEIIKMVGLEGIQHEKLSMIATLVKCTDNNSDFIESVVRYYIKTFVNHDMSYKNQFVNNLLQNSDFHKYNHKTWSDLNQMLNDMLNNAKSDDVFEESIEIIILYKVLHGEKVPELAETKITSTTLKKYYKNLNPNEKDMVFKYLFNHFTCQLNQQGSNTECDFKKGVEILQDIVVLISNWGKNLSDFPEILEKIKVFLKINKEHSYNISLEPLYDIEKSWRKYMFEESLALCPSERVCLNALKHDPGLIMRYKDEVKTLSTNDKLSIENVLKKMRIYWSESLCSYWKDEYVARLNTSSNHKSLIRGLCALLPEAQIIDIVKSYAPDGPKINWSEIDEVKLSLQRYIATNMHFARPQLIPEAILWYAQGDYLKFALPSILSIFYNLSLSRSREYIPKLINTQVSLQKHGIRIAYMKLESTELKQLFYDAWNNTKNVSIRSVIFQLTYKRLCKEDETRAKNLWEIMELFIENLSFTEDKKVYDILPKVAEVPKVVQADYLMKSHKFLKKLLPHAKTDEQTYRWYIDTLAKYTRNIMDLVCPDFVAEIISEFLESIFFKYQGRMTPLSRDMLTVISAYLLCAKDLESQMKKYESIFVPLMNRSFDMWQDIKEGSYYVRLHLRQLLGCLTSDLKDYVAQNDVVIPYQMYLNIQEALSKSLVPVENYILLTQWDLTVALTKLLQSMNRDEEWECICAELASDFGKICLEHLKDHEKKYFSGIYPLFTQALQPILDLFPINDKYTIYRTMLSDKDFVQGYLAVVKLHHVTMIETEEISAIHKLIDENPSIEVKMHYYNKFKDVILKNREECVS